MIESIMSLLEATTPALRERYLERVRDVQGEDARQLEERLTALIAREHAEQDR